MLRKFWLLFAQACTVSIAALFVVATLRPDLLPRLAMHEPGGSVVVTQEAHTLVNVPRVASYADAARKAMPAVVNIYTSKEVRARNPWPRIRSSAATSPSSSAAPRSGRRAWAPA